MADITVLTSVYLNTPERWQYLEQTIDSFYRNCAFPGKIHHNILDDRSPLYQDELQRFCEERGLRLIGRTDPARRRGFYDAYKTLVDSVETELYLYLEPDQYFFHEYDFITPIQRLFEKLPDLTQVYLRAPLVYERPLSVGDKLVTYDGTRLRKVTIDQENTGWVGYGHTHESFSLAPSVFRTQPMKRLLESGFISGEVAAFEFRLERSWRGRVLVGYLNAQAFCYHIGKSGKHGPGNYLSVGDEKYEAIWRQKTLDYEAISLLEAIRRHLILLMRALPRIVRRARFELAWLIKGL